MTLDRIIALHTRARGGRAAIESVHAIELTLLIVEPENSVRGVYAAVRDGLMRIDVFAEDERVFSEGLAPEGGWQLARGATVGSDLSSAGRGALQRGLTENLFGLHEHQSLGYTLALVGSRHEAGQDYWQISHRAPDGFTKQLFVDSRSYLIARDTETSALHPDMAAATTEQETRYEDFAWADGVLFARRSEKFDLDQNRLIQSVEVTTLRINGDIDSGQFRRPQ